MHQPKPPLDPSLPPPRPAPRRTPRSSSRRSPRLSPKHSPPPSAFPDSSSGLLALLVTVAGSNSVYGRPAASDIPPDFLCPRLHAYPSSSQPISSQDFDSSSPWAPCDDSSDSFPGPSTATFSSQPSHTTSNLPRSSRPRAVVTIADKYEQSPDGRWRKASSWELYGSQSCAVAQCMDTTPTEVPVEDDQVSATTAVTSSIASSSSTAPSLPNGWDKTHTSDDLTGIILALSLSLAVSLILFMIGIVLWRKKRRRKRSDADSEKTAFVPQLSEEAKHARCEQRKYTRITARFAAKVRKAARHRRKHTAAIVAKGSSTGQLSESRMAEGSSSAVSLAQTRTISDSLSYVSRPRSIRSVSRTRSRSRSPSVASIGPDSGVDTPCPHPPAYIHDDASIEHPPHRKSLDSRDCHDDLYQEASHLPITPPPPCSPLQSLPSSPIPYEPPLHSAHVATDDKALLARMARLASAPPIEDRSRLTDAPGTSESRPSVPALEDDGFEPMPPDMEDGVTEDVSAERAVRAHDASYPAPESSSIHIASHLHHKPDTIEADLDLAIDSDGDGEVPSYAEDARRHPGTLVMPPPPGKLPLAGPTFYEYREDFEEDVANAEPTLGPSSPPFEEQPSAPPFDFDFAGREHEGHAGQEEHAFRAAAHLIAPSAPPLEYADESWPSAVGALPSAPPVPPSPDSLDGDSHEASISTAVGVGERASCAPTPMLLLPAAASPSDDRGSVGANTGARARSAPPPPHSSPHPPSSRFGDALPPRYLP